MSFPKKTRNIMIGICILCMILIPFVVVGILPFLNSNEFNPMFYLICCLLQQRTIG
ncbi:MAG: hypothetical protein K0S04_4556 [Herbinix sp.]|nr:hypothetical protein [Herbinix sp.]